jgi:hypothetical protein
MDDSDLDPIDETAKPVLSDSELSDVDEEAFAGIDTTRIGIESDEEEEGPNVFALKPAKRAPGTGERKRRRAEETEERRRRRQQRREEKEERKRRIAETQFGRWPDETPEEDPNQRPEDPEAARRWDLDRAMESAISKKQVKRKKKNEEVCSIL